MSDVERTHARNTIIVEALPQRRDRDVVVRPFILCLLRDLDLLGASFHSLRDGVRDPMHLFVRPVVNQNVSFPNQDDFVETLYEHLREVYGSSDLRLLNKKEVRKTPRDKPIHALHPILPFLRDRESVPSVNLAPRPARELGSDFEACGVRCFGKLFS